VFFLCETYMYIHYRGHEFMKQDGLRSRLFCECVIHIHVCILSW
jgi:hypothetical protein